MRPWLRGGLLIVDQPPTIQPRSQKFMYGVILMPYVCYWPEADLRRRLQSTHNGHQSHVFERDITLGYPCWALLVHEFAIAVNLSLMIRVEMMAAMLSKNSYGSLGFANYKSGVAEFDT